VVQGIVPSPLLPVLQNAPETLLARIGDLSGEQVDDLLTALLQRSADGLRR
jgi:hypothetical protein